MLPPVTHSAKKQVFASLAINFVAFSSIGNLEATLENFHLIKQISNLRL